MRTSFRARAVLVVAAFSLASVMTATAATTVAAEETGTTHAAAPPTAPSFTPQAPSLAVPSGDVTANAKDCWWDGYWWCDIVYNTPVYAPGTSTIVGRLPWSPARFSCRSDAGGHVGGPHPNRWEWAPNSDTGEPGWVKDTAIYNETDPLPVC